jgi:hypothetical protein
MISRLKNNTLLEIPQMKNTKNKSLNNPESLFGDLKSIARSVVKVLKEGFKTFPEDLKNFEKNHEEKRKRLFSGIRRRSSRRIV